MKAPISLLERLVEQLLLPRLDERLEAIRNLLET
jgi:hypothetical protein